MKKTFIIFLFVMLCTNIGFSTTHTITNSGFSFTPSTLTISLGDTVKFVLDAIHEPREVSQATWNANGTTLLNGGFDLPSGGGTIVLTSTGTHYYVCVPHASGGMKGTIIVNALTDINSLTNNLPYKFELMQNYPNPFNPSTIIRYGLVSESKVSIKIYSLLGEEIQELVNNTEAAGFHEVNFNAGNLASGIYFYKISADATDGKRTFSDTKKLLLMK